MWCSPGRHHWTTIAIYKHQKAVYMEGLDLPTDTVLGRSAPLTGLLSEEFDEDTPQLFAFDNSAVRHSELFSLPVFGRHFRMISARGYIEESPLSQVMEILERHFPDNIKPYCENDDDGYQPALDPDGDRQLT